MASRLVVGDQTARALCEVALLLVRSAVPLWAVLTKLHNLVILVRIILPSHYSMLYPKPRAGGFDHRRPARIPLYAPEPTPLYAPIHTLSH